LTSLGQERPLASTPGTGPTASTGLPVVVMRAAIVEFNWWHDEVIPTLVHALNRMGFFVDVYMPRKAISADAFAFARDLRYEILPTDGLGAAARGTPARRRRYDLTIANSIEPDVVLRKVDRIPGPMLAVVHNAGRIGSDPEFAAFFDSPRRFPIVLWDHLAACLPAGSPGTWAAPVYLGEVPPQERTADETNFCIQGTLSFSRRNYGSLLAAVETLGGAAAESMRLTFAGESDFPDGRAFRSSLPARGPKMEFTAPWVPYMELYRAIAASDFILPLIDTTAATYAPYFIDKMTTSLAVGIGLGIPSVIHSRLAELYGVADASICYEDGGLAEAMARAMAMPESERSLLRERLRERRDALLDANEANLRAAVDRVGR
jgi:hypothetical protein